MGIPELTVVSARVAVGDVRSLIIVIASDLRSTSKSSTRPT